jgi:hypothetical protein
MLHESATHRIVRRHARFQRLPVLKNSPGPIFPDVRGASVEARFEPTRKAKTFPRGVELPRIGDGQHETPPKNAPRDRAALPE